MAGFTGEGEEHVLERGLLLDVLHLDRREELFQFGEGPVLDDRALVQDRDAVVEAGAVVEPFTRIPPGEVWGGNPARFRRRRDDVDLAPDQDAASAAAASAPGVPSRESARLLRPRRLEPHAVALGNRGHAFAGRAAAALGRPETARCQWASWTSSAGGRSAFSSPAKSNVTPCAR